MKKFAPLLVFLLALPLIGAAQGISQLQQFTATTSPERAITQTAFGKPFRLTGQGSGCAQFSSNGTLTSTGTACGTGGSSFAYPFPSNATSTLLSFNGGASTTNLTVSGNEYIGPGVSQWVQEASSTLANALVFQNPSISYPYLTLQTTGNIGISSSSPSALLSVQGAAAGSVPIVRLATTTATNVRNSAFEVNSQGSVFMGLNGARVGIGNTSPTEKLPVTGNQTVSGKITTNALAALGTADFFTAFNIFDGAWTEYLDSSFTGAARFWANSSLVQFTMSVAASFGRQFVMGDQANNGKDYDHAAQTNPTLYVQSATDPDTDNTQWISLTHNQTTGVIASGKGGVTFPDGGVSAISLGSAVPLTVTVDSPSVPTALIVKNANNFANSADLVKFSQLNGSDSGSVLHLNTAGTGPALWVETGKVGIGTSSPAVQLHVSNGPSATTTVEFDARVTTSRTCFNVRNDSGVATSFYFHGTAMIVEVGYCK